jgi:Pectate lyase superfamily protein
LASHGVINVGKYTVANGVADDGPGIQAAIDALDAYSGGQGGGTILFPEGVYQITSTITGFDTGSQGISLIGTGSHSSIIRGTVAGPLLTNDSGTQEVYNRIEGLGFMNQSTNSAARAIKTNNMNELVLKDCLFSCSASGSASSAAQLDSTYDLLVEGCAFEGSSLDHCIVGDTQNVATYLRNSLRNSKGGIRIASGTGVNLIGNSFQAMTGTATDGFDGCVSLGGCQGGIIGGNYLESCNTPFFKCSSSSYGYEIGGNFITNPGGTSAIFAASMNHSLFAPNTITPGANAANIHGVDAASSDQCTFMTQRIASGTGVAILNLSTATNATDLRTQLNARNSVIVLQKAGIPADSDFTLTPANGTLAVDTTNNKLYVRIGGTWKGVVVA